ncbi:RNA 2',3'-cyclic phosphodiesterase [bacterium]|nr:RNA 2',3'-cyclic phosphodiesterase [bacterium]
MRPRYDPRVFLALCFSRITQDKLAALQQQLRPQLTNWHWIPPYNTHLTLRFFGEVQESVVADIDAGCREIAPKLSPFQFNITRIDFFGKPEHARVLFATGDITSGMLSLVKALQARFPEQGEEQRREFRPHITLAKARKSMDFRDEAKNARVLARLRDQGPPEGLDLNTVHRELVLMETVWVGRAVEYQSRARYPLEAVEP